MTESRSTPDGRRWRPRNPFTGLPPEVGVLAAVALSVAVGFGIVAPALPVFARQFGVSRTAAGAVISAFALMRLVSALAGGRLVDRLGERLVLGLGLGIVGLSTLLAGFSQSYDQLLVLRGAGGIGSAMFTVASLSLLLRVVGPDQRARASGLYQGGFLLGGIGGPALGGLLTTASVRTPFFVYGATLAVAATIALLALRGTALADRSDAAATARTTLAQALRMPAYRAALAINFGTGFVLFGARASLVPLYVVEGLDRAPVWTGIGLTASALVTASLLLRAGRFSDTRGRRPALVTGASLATGGVLLLAAPSGLVGYLVGMVLLGVGSSFVSTSSGAVVGDVVGGRGGSTVAAYQMASDLGVVSGPLLAGLLADRYGFAPAFGACVVVLGIGLIAALRMPETRNTAPSPA